MIEYRGHVTLEDRKVRVNNIKYYTKQNYGTDHTYLADLHLAGKVRLLTGKKTIDAVDMDALSAVFRFVTGQPIEFVEVK